ncbi:MAG: hypothetical protein ARM1_0493 [Candidatus Micrarchaeota archaeon]|nr:MAG: hypothetical protein ARM1_0493 [Candidatus Micrarchaeota archaeon]
MAKYFLGRQLVGKRVITNDGFDLGRLLDLEVDATGKIQGLITEINPDSSLSGSLKAEEGQINIPYVAVVAVNDYIIVDRKRFS